MDGYTAPLSRPAAEQYLREVHDWSQEAIDTALGKAVLTGSYRDGDVLHGLHGFYIRNS